MEYLFMGMRRILVGMSAVIMGGVMSAQDGTLDATFNPTDQGFSLGDGPNYGISTINLEPDGKLFLGGAFTRFDSTQVGRVAQVNADGSLDTSFNPGGSGTGSPLTCSTIQPDGKIIIAGYFSSYNGTGGQFQLSRLIANGALDASFTHVSGGVNASILTISVQADGRIIIGGYFSLFGSMSRSRIARLNADGSLDNSFDPGTGFYHVNGAQVQTVALQADGKIIVGGDFTQFNGAARNRIARLNADGSLDPAFNPGAGADQLIRSIALQSDGKIIIGGDLTSYGGIACGGIARLNADGSLDTSFDPGTGADGSVYTTTLQPNGKVLVGGVFPGFNGTSLRNLVRLNSDGSLDPSFDPGTGPDLAVNAICIQPDGKILVSGNFRTYNGVVRPHLLRLNEVGGRDATYLPAGKGAADQVLSLCFQPDGKILLGGRFGSSGYSELFGYNGTPLNGIGRLNVDGSLDPSFVATTGANLDWHDMAMQADGKVIVGKAGSLSPARLNANGSLDPLFDPGTGVQGGVIRHIVVQVDGKVLIGGSFTTFNGVPRGCIARLNADGSLDASFNPGSGFYWNSTQAAVVNSINLQADGKLVVGGYFWSFNGVARRCIARLNADGSNDASFNTGTGLFAFNNTQYVYTTALQPDGKVVVGGLFTSYNGTARRNIARLNANGSIDGSFDPGFALNTYSSIYTTLVQPDGRVLVGGIFNTITGPTRKNMMRLNPDGSLDASFNQGMGTNAWVNSFALQVDGGIIIGGVFTSCNGVGRNRIARINGTARTGIRVMLEGPYASGLMSDALRNLPSFPLTEPFTAQGYSRPVFIPGATIAPSVLSTTGNNVIVDWVIVEMRPSATPSVVSASRAVLLQRDGDIVDLDGVSTVGFSGLAPGNYCVAVISRNHLPVMLSPSTPIAYGGAVATVDFTLPSTALYNANASKNVSGTMLLKAGDVTFDATLSYVGLNNDRDPILVRVGGSTPTATVSGYYREDVNMDGIVKYVGAANDRDPILLNIGGSVPTATVSAPLP